MNQQLSFNFELHPGRGIREGFRRWGGSDERGVVPLWRRRARIPAKHPLRRTATEAALAEHDGRFSALNEAVGCPSIPLERCYARTLLQLLYSIRSERGAAIGRPELSTPFCLFVGLTIDEIAFNASTSSKTRDHLLTREIKQNFQLASQLSSVKGLISSEHFSVDEILIKAEASMNGFRPKDGGGGPPPGHRSRLRAWRSRSSLRRGSDATNSRTVRPAARGRHS